MIGCLGECLIDFTPVVRDGRTTGFDFHPGGSPYNVAIAAARLAYPTAFVGRASTDLFGRILVDRLTEDGVDTSLLLRGPEPTTLAFVAFEDGEPRYSFRAEGAADTLIRPDDISPDDLLGLEVLHCGSISLLTDPTAHSVLVLARALSGRLALSFDPNVRPELVRDWDGYRALLGELAGLADLVKASEADLEVWGEDPERLATDPAGPCVVVVTRGARGSRLYRSDLVLDVGALPCRVADTVGAGDAFSAAVLVALARRGALSRAGMAQLGADEWRSVLAFAAAAAALTCEREGANPPTAEAVDDVLGARA